jgi:hypothetical protein
MRTHERGWSSDRRGVRVQGHGLTRDHEDGVPRNPSWSQRGILSLPCARARVEELCRNPGRRDRYTIASERSPPYRRLEIAMPPRFSRGSAPWVGPGCHRRSPRENS